MIDLIIKSQSNVKDMKNETKTKGLQRKITDAHQNRHLPSL